MISWRFALVVACVGIMLAGCDSTSLDEFEPEYVVEGYLRAGDRLPVIRVSRTIELDASYDPSGTGIADALVSVSLLNEAGEIDELTEYRSSEDNPGYYIPDPGTGETPMVQPLRTYELLVDVPDASELITATTFVPDTFSISRSGPDSVEYQASEQFSFLVSPTTYPGRQNVFLFTTLARDAGPDTVTPFGESLLEDSELTIEDLREQASPLLNEENFERTDNDFLLIRFPWLGVYFYGRNRVSVSALDDNLHDFIRSQSVQQGGSTLPPGEIPNVLERVDGGRGVFGSYSRANISIYVLESTE